MTREEAASYFPYLPEIKHSMCRRSPWHDYRDTGLYMLTVVIKDRKPLLGTLESNPCPHVKRSPLGHAIATLEFKKIVEFYPMVEVWQTCIMPDHIHMIIYVSAPLPEGTHLGHIIGGFKGGCTRRWWTMSGYIPSTEDDRKSNPLFENNYHDRLLYSLDHLEIWKKYLQDNPRRLSIKRQHPHLFTTLYRYMINGSPYNIYGNRFLLDNPDKMAVIVHRRDSDQDFMESCRRWLDCGERGGVLVSAAIARREKAVMRLAMERGYSMILLRENGFPRIYKPSGEAFDACAQGRLLQISPHEYHYDKRDITRVDCLQLNDIARAITEGQ